MKTQGVLQAEMMCVCASKFIYVQHTGYLCFKKGQPDKESLLKQGKFSAKCNLLLRNQEPE